MSELEFVSGIKTDKALTFESVIETSDNLINGKKSKETDGLWTKIIATSAQ